MTTQAIVARLRETSGLVSDSDKKLILEMVKWFSSIRSGIGGEHVLDRLLPQNLPFYSLPVIEDDFDLSPKSKDYRKSTYEYRLKTAKGLIQLAKSISKFPNPPSNLNLSALSKALTNYAKSSEQVAETIFARGQRLVETANTIMKFVPWLDYVKPDGVTQFNSAETTITGQLKTDSKQRFVARLGRYVAPDRDHPESNAPWGLTVFTFVRSSRRSGYEFFDLEKGFSKEDFQKRFMGLFETSKKMKGDTRQTLKLLKTSNRKLTFSDVSLLSTMLSVSNLGIGHYETVVKDGEVKVTIGIGNKADTYSIDSDEERKRSGTYIWNTLLSYVGGDASEDDMDDERDSWIRELRNKDLFYVAKTWGDLLDICLYISQHP